MIKKVHLRNFKSIEEETFELTDFDLLVGANNSGKSTLLQALSIWQYCVDEFKRSKRSGSRGIQIVLPNFTALSLPEFILLWKDKIERKNIKVGKKTKPEFILVDIEVCWQSEKNEELSLTVQLRYQSPQSIYAIPVNGWEFFQKMEQSTGFPNIVYVPPFSALEPFEKWQDNGNVKQNVGKGQPGSVLRNLLYRVVDKDIPVEMNSEWTEIKEKIREWFGVELKNPEYEKGISTMIGLSYVVKRKDYDIISGGSGFHQILTLLAFFYGYPGITTILFDEPDAHLHVNLQKQILHYFKKQNRIQFLIATHAEEFIRGVEVNSIISMLSGKPQRIQSTEHVVRAMSEVDNMVVIKTKQSPYILYVEGEDDGRILTSWAASLEEQEMLSKFYIFPLGGTTKLEMKKRAEAHFNALKQINTEVKRVMLFDFDSEETAFHPDADNSVLKEWKRRNIENYLLVPEAWERAVLDLLRVNEFNLFNSDYQKIINDFFSEQGLILPKGFTWTNVKANIFQVVDGKKILFENRDSLFHRLKTSKGIVLNREKLASKMDKNMIHSDVLDFFDHLKKIAMA